MASKTSCKRRSMYINFEEIGWKKWIIAPAGFEAYYCGGQCGYDEAQVFSFFIRVALILNSILTLLWLVHAKDKPCNDAINNESFHANHSRAKLRTRQNVVPDNTVRRYRCRAQCATRFSRHVCVELFM